MSGTIGERSGFRADGRRKGMHPRRWTTEQDGWLRSRAGTLPIGELTDALNARFHATRTPEAVRIRAVRLGLSLWPRGYSMRDLERAFGASHHTIIPHWIEAGHLHGRRRAGRGPYDGWWFADAEVERFVRECGWLYHRERIKAGHPLARLAEVAHRADPWIFGLDAVGRALGMATVQVKKWSGRGLIPHRRRPSAGKGAGEMAVRGRDVPAIRAAIAEARERAREANRERFTAMRRRQLREAAA